MSNTTANQSPLIKAQLYSEFMLEQIYDGFMPDGLHRDVSDFGDGETLNIPVMGETVLRDYEEDEAIKYDAVDTGQITLVINQYKSAASYVTKKLQQDGYKAAAVEAAIPGLHLRKIRETYESDLLNCQRFQTAADENAVNGFSHRWVANSGATLGLMDLEDFVYAKLAFDKAEVPDEGRIAIVDPATEATINSFVATQGFTNNPQFEGMVESGFARGRKFIRNIFGFDVWVSNRLPTGITETIDGGPQNASTAASGFSANVFMSVLDDQTKPFMGAWRQMPETDGEYNKDKQRDEYVTTARWGFGLQRPETLITVLTNAAIY